MSTGTAPRGAAARFEEASSWRARIAQDPNLAESATFKSWLQEPENRARYAQVDHTWDVVGLIGATPPVLAARQRSLHALRRHARGATARRRVAAGLVAAACALVMVLAGFNLYRETFVAQTFTTGPLERRIVMLADGSRVGLDSETRLDVWLTPGERRLTLTRGQASFAVAHDADRPFRVITQGRIVVATGTRFNIDLFGPLTTVTLAEGRVLVSHTRASGHDAPVALAPGQQLIARGEADQVRPVDPAVASAWEQGDVIFDDDLLPAAIARFNRYAHRRWRVDPALSAVKISGVFDATDPDAFLDVITSYFAIEASVAADGSVVLRPAPPRPAGKKIAAAR